MIFIEKNQILLYRIFFSINEFKNKFTIRLEYQIHAAIPSMVCLLLSAEK